MTVARASPRKLLTAGAVLAVLALIAVVVVVATTSDEHRRSTRVDEPDVWSSPRDARTWPFPPDSIWNHPRGRGARLVPAELTRPDSSTLSAEEDILVLEPSAEPRTIWRHDAGWDPNRSRCQSQTNEVLVTGVPIPQGWFTDPGFVGRTPNHAAAVLLPDGSLLETQPLHVCPDGTVVSQYASQSWRGTSIHSGQVAGDIGEGAHGGSGITAFGGTIRLGEWVPGGVIPHAVKIEVDAAANLWGGEGPRFRWPASRADGDSTHYGGDVPELTMGALLTLPPELEVESLRSEAARILARALQRYGAYVVDDSGWSSVAFATEWGPQGRVLSEFEEEWGFPLPGHVGDAEGEQRAFLQDLESLYSSLAVVADNGPESIGGPGKRLAPPAPPFETAGSTSIRDQRPSLGP